MKKVIKVQQPVIYFRRWSRKGYAVFCSIGRCVSVRQLRKNVAEASLKKQKSALAVCLWKSTGGFDIDIEGEAEPDLPDICSQLLSMSIHPQATTEVCGSVYFVLRESEDKIAG
ncbi:MAG: hypothetical protein LBC19_12860 [Tannerella sp.]|jgi:hypothetical protein|nr:hypothetical protein [Tannerella sp.]